MFFSFSISAQEKKEDPPVVNIFSSDLRTGELLVFGDKSVKFEEVISDSRCPKEVTCVWAGEAKVKVAVFKNGNFLEEKVILIGENNIPLNFSVEDVIYSISGMVLSPYPTVGNKETKPEYTLHMRVTEKL